MQNEPSSSTGITKLNVANLVAYILNVVITYVIGASNLFSLPTNAELSEKYQTIVTPAGWAFAIWGIIFISQLVWVVYQTAVPSQRSSPFVSAVAYNYVWVCVAQIGWTLCFTFEVIFPSVVCMLGILLFLARIVFALNDQFSIKDYILWKFPFTLHCGWIIAASIVNINVMLVYLELSAIVLFYSAIGSLVALLAVAMSFLAKDSVVVVPVIWALFGVQSELKAPKESITAVFSAQWIDYARYGAIGVASLLSVFLVVKVVRSFRASRNKESTSPDEGTYLRHNE